MAIRLFLATMLLLAFPCLATATTFQVQVDGTTSFTSASTPLGGIPGCGMQIGSHSYGTESLTTMTSATYEIRATSSTGLGSDPFLAIYSPTFDPANPTLNLVACNDDSAGYALPLFTAALAANTQYVVVGTTYRALPSTGSITFSTTPNVSVGSNPSLLVSPSSAGGSVSADSGAIAGCSSSGGTCSDSYATGSTIVLTATPNANYTTSWTSGCSSSSGNTCTVSNLTANATVNVAFLPPVPLTVSPSSAGGSVSADSGAISGCSSSDGTCSDSYATGSTIVLTATPIANYTTSWTSGCSSSSGNTCTVSNLTASATVNVAFLSASQVPISSALGYLSFSLGFLGIGVLSLCVMRRRH